MSLDIGRRLMFANERLYGPYGAWVSMTRYHSERARELIKAGEMREFRTTDPNASDRDKRDNVDQRAITAIPEVRDWQMGQGMDPGPRTKEDWREMEGTW